MPRAPILVLAEITIPIVVVLGLLAYAPIGFPVRPLGAALPPGAPTARDSSPRPR